MPDVTVLIIDNGPLKVVGGVGFDGTLTAMEAAA